MFNGTTKPTSEEVYYWLISTDNGISRFHNIGSLSSLLICGDLIEAGLVIMPTSRELGKLVFKVGKGAKDGMTKIGLVRNGADRKDLCDALESLDLVLQQELTDDEKNAMGYNVIMLEHTLCKIKRLMNSISLISLQLEIN